MDEYKKPTLLITAALHSHLNPFLQTLTYVSSFLHFNFYITNEAEV